MIILIVILSLFTIFWVLGSLMGFIDKLLGELVYPLLLVAWFIYIVVYIGSII